MKLEENRIFILKFEIFQEVILKQIVILILILMLMLLFTEI